MRKATAVNLANRLVSRLSKQIAYKRDFFYGKVYDSYGLCDEVELVVNIANKISITDSIVLDVGANKGDYSALLAASLGKSSEIHCFEPSINHKASLCALQYQYKGNILYHPFGLSSNEGSKQLYKDREGSGLASFYDRDIAHHGLSLDQNEVVITTTLDHWLKSSGISRITFLKVDVEGHELEVFRGGAHVLSSGLVDALQFEFGGCNIDSKTYFRDFFSLLHTTYGFKLFRLAPGKRLVDMNRYSEALECFTWQNIVGFRNISSIPCRYTIIHE
jgi:FkbM family methyltransferase